MNEQKLHGMCKDKQSCQYPAVRGVTAAPCTSRVTVLTQHTDTFPLMKSFIKQFLWDFLWLVILSKQI